MVVLAGDEARRRGHGLVGAEHALLAMIRDGEGIAICALRRLGCDMEALEQRIEGALGESAQAPAQAGTLEFTPELKHAFELAVEEARALRHPHLGTEDLLLGIMRLDESRAGTILRAGGARLDEVRHEVRILTGAPIPFSDENLRLINHSPWLIRP
ncbi:MAG: ATP-dependent Clp protease ATP-binding subunit [Candidatus Rokubacteria bacterium]|nr:ATP-dependent Clp protease ATP-binding subunit [Candidatus Rokubacteria bacterium]